MYVYRGNANTAVRRCSYTGCSAPSGAGGAVRFWDLNEHTSLEGLRVQDCSANQGGGIAFEEVGGASGWSESLPLI